MTNNNSAKTALVTGGTSGIGHHIAHNFAKDGYNLILVARDEGELSDCADHFRKKHGIEVMTIAKDLMDPQAAEEVYNHPVEYYQPHGTDKAISERDGRPQGW